MRTVMIFQYLLEQQEAVAVMRHRRMLAFPCGKVSNTNLTNRFLNLPNPLKAKQKFGGSERAEVPIVVPALVKRGVHTLCTRSK